MSGVKVNRGQSSVDFNATHLRVLGMVAYSHNTLMRCNTEKHYFHFDADDSDHQVWVFLNARDDVTFPCVVTSKL